MLVWKIRFKPRETGSFDRTRSIRVSPTFVATRKNGLKALSKDRETEAWTLEGLFGLLIERYEARFYRHWPFSSSEAARDIRNLEILVQRVGTSEAAQAIRIIFTEQFKWVHNPGLMLSHRDFYFRNVVPALQAEKDRQEAQWKGSREGESRVVSADEFFGR